MTVYTVTVYENGRALLHHEYADGLWYDVEDIPGAIENIENGAFGRWISAKP